MGTGLTIDHYDDLTWSLTSLGIPDRKHSDSEARGLELRLRLVRPGTRGGGAAREVTRLWLMSREASEVEASSQARPRLVRLLWPRSEQRDHIQSNVKTRELLRRGSFHKSFSLTKLLIEI